MEVGLIGLIQAMLAPGLMISASALLIAGMNNRYSLVVNRIRLLEEESRKMKTFRKERALNQLEESRFESVNLQLQKLNFRLKLVRNAVLAYSSAVLMFIAASLFIGFKFLLNVESLEKAALSFFLIGMFSVLIGVLYAALEVVRGYQIVQIEIHEG